MKLTASEPIEPGWHRLAITAIEEARDSRGAACLRWRLVTADGEPFTTFTPSRFGKRANARMILEAAAGEPLGKEVDTETAVGRVVRGRIIVHPASADDWRRRLAEVRGDSAATGGFLLGPNGRTWDKFVAEGVR